MKQFVSMESFSHLFREKREVLLSFWNLKKTQNIILGLFLLFAAVFCCREAARSPFWGSDASEYFLMQRGFEQTFSPRIPMNSYAEACKEIPESIRYPVPPPSYPNSTGHGNAGVTLYNGSVYAYHSVIYSVFTLPFKYIAGIFILFISACCQRSAMDASGILLPAGFSNPVDVFARGDDLSVVDSSGNLFADRSGVIHDRLLQRMV